MRNSLIRAIAAGFAAGAASSGCQSTHKASLANHPEVLDRVEAILSQAAPDCLEGLYSQPMAHSAIEFTRSGGTGAMERLEMLPDPVDPKNGIDDDADGLVDEVLLVWTNASGAPQVLCSNVLPQAAGEKPNGVDDNGNGLIDENGVAFHVVDPNGTVAVGITLCGPDGTISSAWRNVTLSKD